MFSGPKYMSEFTSHEEGHLNMIKDSTPLMLPTHERNVISKRNIN